MRSCCKFLYLRDGQTEMVVRPKRQMREKRGRPSSVAGLDNILVHTGGVGSYKRGLSERDLMIELTLYYCRQLGPCRSEYSRNVRGMNCH